MLRLTGSRWEGRYGSLERSRLRGRRSLSDGETVCSIIDWEMDLPLAPMTSAEILQVRDGQIVQGELIYDAQELRDCDGGE